MIDGLTKGGTHGNVLGQVGGEAAVKIWRPGGAEVRGETAVVQWQVVVLLLVHLLVDDILLGDSE